MANIELFDKYINSELSEKEMADFKNRLEEDKDFAIDFNIIIVKVKTHTIESRDNVWHFR